MQHTPQTAPEPLGLFGIPVLRLVWFYGPRLWKAINSNPLAESRDDSARPSSTQADSHCCKIKRRCSFPFQVCAVCTGRRPGLAGREGFTERNLDI